MPIGQNVKELREKKGYSQAELGKLSGIGSTYISKLENNQCSPGYEKIKKLVIALETTADKLIFDEDEDQIKDELKPLFKIVSTLDDEQKDVVKMFLKGWITACKTEELRKL